jgi:hypothetical protein
MRQESSRNIRTTFMALIITCSLLACVRSEPHPDAPTTTPSPLETKTIPTATTQPATSTTISTPSPSPLPSMPTRWPTVTPRPTNTPSPQPSVTWTALPTLWTLEVQKTVTAFYENNGGCELPCWWGITPGKTTWLEARAKLSPLATELGPYKIGKKEATAYVYHFPFPLRFHPYNLVDFGPLIVIQDGIVFDVGINSAEIWLKIGTESQNNMPAYELHLFYAHKGFLLGSLGYGYLSEKSVLFCPQATSEGPYPFWLYLFAPSSGVTYEALTEMVLDRDTSVNKFHLLRELIDDFDEADFYRLYSDPATDKCLTIPLDKLR